MLHKNSSVKLSGVQRSLMDQKTLQRVLNDARIGEITKEIDSEDEIHSIEGDQDVT